MPNWWPFKKQSPVENPELAYRAAEIALRQEIESRLQTGMSRQSILHFIETESQVLEKSATSMAEKARLRALDGVYGRIKNDLLSNLSEGKSYEMAGRLEEAITCYETAVSDQIATRFPYEHLRIIYRQRNQPDEALRVCRLAAQNPYLSPADHAHFQTWAQKLETIRSFL